MDEEYNTIIMPERQARFVSRFQTISLEFWLFYVLLMIDGDGDLFAHLSIGDLHLTFDSYSSSREFDASFGKYHVSFEENKFSFERY